MMQDSVSKELLEAGWGYERLFVPALFEVWTGHVVDAAAIRSGNTVLDVACGTGVLARAVAARVAPGGSVTGVDVAPGMLAVAARLEPTTDWKLGAAESLGLGDGAFDRVVSQFGVMFFDDLDLALSEMLRVLRPRGSVAIAAWRSVEHNPAYADLSSVLEEQVGTDAADALRAPFSLGDADSIADAMTRIGFSDVRCDAAIERACFPSARHMVEAELRGWLPLFDINLEEDVIGAVLAAADLALEHYVDASGQAVFPTSAHIISARKP